MAAFEELRARIARLWQGDNKDVSRSGTPQITPDNVPPGALADLWTLHDQRMPKTPKRIQDARDFLAGEKRAPMPAEFDPEDRESCRADGAAKYRRAHDTARRLGAKRARISRPKAGESKAAARASTGIEQFANGVLEKLYPWQASVENLLNEGELFLFMSPSPTNWQYIPTLYDEDADEGPHLTEDEYGQVPENRRGEYERYDAEIEDDATEDEDAAMLAAATGESEETDGKVAPTTRQEPRYKRVARRYRVDAEGRADDDSDDFRMDRDESNAFYAEELAHAYGTTIPIVVELVHRQDCIPINPRESGDRIEVDGVIRRSLFSRSELVRRRYRWFDMDEQLEPVNARDGIDGDFYLYEYRTYDEQRRPFIVYQVGERSTTRDDETAVIKLWEEYPGITDILVHYDLGMHWSGANWDLNSMPFTKPYMQDMLNRDAFMTGMVITGWNSGFPTWGQKMTQEGLALAKLDGDVDLNFNMRPNTVVPIYGDLIELTSKGTNIDIKAILASFGEEVDREMPSPGAFGGEGPTSGLDRQVQGKDMEIAHGDVIEAARRMYEAAGRFTLMIGSALAKKAKRPIELWIMSETPVVQTGQQTTSYSVVKLTGDQCGRNYDVVAEYPNVPGENLAGASLFMSLQKAGLLLREEFRTLWGDPSPEIFEAKLRLERYYDSEAGQLDLLQGLADYLADNRMKKLLQLTAKGAMTAVEGGAPTSAMNDLMGAGGQAAPGMAGGGQNPGQQALAGGNAGAIQADAASAGSPMDGFSNGGLGTAA